MAWNEPGNGNQHQNNDSWGGKRPSDQRPPDLDEVFAKLQERLTTMFGGKPGRPGSGSGSGNVGSWGGVLLLAMMLLVVYVLKRNFRSKLWLYL